jgi:hypothetical protein
MGDLNVDGMEDVVAFGLPSIDAGTQTNLVLQGGDAIEMWQVLSALPTAAAISFLPEGRLDFNGDRVPDVFFRPAFASDRVSIALGTAGSLDSQLQYASTVGGRTGTMCTGDLNGDGFSDVALSGSTPGEVLVYRGGVQGLNTPSNSRIVFRSGFVPLTLVSPGDTDGDGFADIIAISSSSGEARMMTARGANESTITASSGEFDVVNLGGSMGTLFALP